MTMAYDLNEEQPVGLIADMAEELRPREKALRHGIKSLTDAELMALIFATGIRGKGVVAMCSEILDDNRGHLSQIAEMDAPEFIERYKGIGPAKALTLLAALELGSRSVADSVRRSNEQIFSSEAAAKIMVPHLAYLDHEEFWILLLRHNLSPIRPIRIGQGGLTATVVDIKMLMRQIILAKASAVMLFHNHPSGTLKPSPQDRQLTQRITDACRLMDVRMLDHIIIAGGSHFSFHDNGLHNP